MGTDTPIQPTPGPRPASTAPAPHPRPRTPRSRWLVPLAFLAFVSLGLPDGVLGVAWPSLRRSFQQPIDRLGLDPAADDGSATSRRASAPARSCGGWGSAACCSAAACSSPRALRSGPLTPVFAAGRGRRPADRRGRRRDRRGHQCLRGHALHAARDHLAARVLGARGHDRPARHDRDARGWPRLAHRLRRAGRRARPPFPAASA